jgi:hypothetical protein
MGAHRGPIPIPIHSRWLLLLLHLLLLLLFPPSARLLGRAWLPGRVMGLLLCALLRCSALARLPRPEALRDAGEPAPLLHQPLPGVLPLQLGAGRGPRRCLLQRPPVGRRPPGRAGLRWRLALPLRLRLALLLLLLLFVLLLRPPSCS